MSEHTDGPVTRRSARLAGKPSTPIPPPFSPTRRSTRLARSTSKEVLQTPTKSPSKAKGSGSNKLPKVYELSDDEETPAQKSMTCRRLSFTDVAQSPKDRTPGKSPSNAKSTESNELPKVFDSSGDEEAAESPKKKDKTLAKSSSSARNKSSKDYESSDDEEIVVIDSPVRRSTRLTRHSSTEIPVEELSKKTNASKRLSFADVGKSPKNSQKVQALEAKDESPSKVNDVVNKDASEYIKASDDQKTPSQKLNTSKRLSFTDVAQSPKDRTPGKSPSNAKTSESYEIPKVFELSDDEEVANSPTKKDKTPAKSPSNAKNSSVKDRESSNEEEIVESPKKKDKTPAKSPSHVGNKSSKDRESESSDGEEEVAKSPAKKDKTPAKSPSLVDNKSSKDRKSESSSDEEFFESPKKIVKTQPKSPLNTKNKSSKGFESSEDEEAVVIDSPVRRSTRLARNSSSEIVVGESSQKANASKRLSFADVAESLKNSQNAQTLKAKDESPSNVIDVDNKDASDNEKTPSQKLNTSKRLSFTDVAQSPKDRTPGKSPSNAKTSESFEIPKVFELSDDEEVVKSPTNADKTPAKCPSNAKNNSAKDRESELSDDEEVAKSPKKKDKTPAKLPSHVDNKSSKERKSESSSDEEVVESPKKFVKTPPKSPSDVDNKLSEDGEVFIIDSPVRRSTRLARNSSSEIVVSKRLSFADVGESPKNSQKVQAFEAKDESPSKANDVVNKDASEYIKASDDQKTPSQKLMTCRRLSFTDVAQSPKDRTPGKSPSNAKSSESNELPKVFDSSGDEEAAESPKKKDKTPAKSPSNAKNSSVKDRESESSNEEEVVESPKKKDKTPAKSPSHVDNKSSKDRESESSDGEEEVAKSPTKKDKTPAKSPSHADNKSSKDRKSESSSDEEFFESPKKIVKTQPKSPLNTKNKSSKSFESSEDEEAVVIDSPDVAQFPKDRTPGKSPFNAKSSNVIYFPVENAAVFFKNRGKNSGKMLKSLFQSYSALNSLSFAASPSLSDDLIVKEKSDNELIWQQISMQNKAVFKEVKKTLKLFGDDLKIPEEGGSDDSEADVSQMEDEQEFEDDDGDDFVEDEEEGPPRKKTKGVDLFNIRPQDLKNLDSKLKAMDNDEDDDADEEAEDDEMDDEEEEEEELVAPPPKKAKKSAVDDKFFSLSEMEKFLNEQEANGPMSDIDDDDDDDDFETDYRYKDFFEESAPKKKNGKKVHFEEEVAEEEENDEDMEEYEDDDDMEEEDDNSAPVLLGSKKEIPKPSSSHEMSREKMLKLIDKIQSENLNPRSWELSGEVKGEDREVNSLLQKYVEADFRKKQPPINSKEKSDKIYSICLRRFKDKLFDDVTRKYRDDDNVQAYRNLTVDMNERKSLMDVYEDKYQAVQNGESGSTEDIDPQVKDIQKHMNELFYKLDALSHLQFAPARISEEIRMVKNMPSMRAEEVGPMASAAADETLLAPEEISRHVKTAPKSKDERTETDKNQERRKKKRKQSDMAKAGKMPKVGKEKEKAAAAASSSKSNKKGKGKDFFAELQNVASREIKEKKEKSDGAMKKRKKPKDKSETAAKYKA